MIMVVFGAGASYDSNPDLRAFNRPHEYRMPLASELFSNRPLFAKILAQFQQCYPILTYLRPEPYEFSLEQELQKLADEANDDPKRNIQLAAVRYYLHVMIKQCEARWLLFSNNITNHQTMLDQLRQREQDGICLVTFNYDQIIEDALRTVGINVGSLDSYIANKDYKLIKLHGSVNWAHPIQLDASVKSLPASDLGRAQWIIDNINRIQIDNHKFETVSAFPMSTRLERYTTLTPGGRTLIGDHTIGLYPAIAIPVQNKSDFECPLDHVDALKAILPNVHQLVVVGWRATEKPFLELLSTCLDRDHPISGLVVAEKEQSAQETIRNLAKTGVLAAANFQMHPSGFTNFVKSRALDQFLKS